MSEVRHWNQPSQNDKSPRLARRHSPLFHGALAALIILVGAGVCAYLILGGKASTVQAPKVEDSRPKMIQEQTPAPAPIQRTEEVAPKPIDPNARPTKVGEVVNGYVMLPSGRIHRRLGVITNSVANRPKGAYHIFESSTDNEIACYLTLKPGETLIGTPRYNGRFKKQFLESLKKPIEITKDDTPEQAQLKQDVIQARMDLKAAMDRGEDIEQIMLDTRQELQDLMRYKMEIKSMFNDARLNSCETEQDVEDLLSACNKMLESKGIAPMKFGPITRRKLMSHKEGEENSK